MAASTGSFRAPYITSSGPASRFHVIHGDGTTTAAKKGGDNLGYSGHKHLKGCKVVAFCDRDCNIIAPFVTAPGNRNESPLLRDALPKVTEWPAPLARTCKAHRQSGWRLRLPDNRKAIFNRGMTPNIPENRAGAKTEAGPQAAL